MADPVSLSLMAVSAGVSAMGAVQQGQSQAAMYNYQSGVAQMNQQIMKQNADYAVAAGEVTAQEKGMETRFKVGETIAQQGAGGLAVGSGSNARVVSSELAIGQQDQALIRSNAMRQAYGYEVEAAKFGAESTMDQYAAANAKTAGYTKAFGSLLSGAAGVSSKWQQLSQYDPTGGGGGPTSKEL